MTGFSGGENGWHRVWTGGNHRGSLEGVADGRDGFLPGGIVRVCRTPRASDLSGSPAIQVRFSRFRGTVQ